MLQLRYSKLKQVFVSVLLPRILLKDIKLYNRTAAALEHFSKLKKSTDSGNNEEQMRIIEKCFAKNVLDNEDKSKEIENENIITPELYNTTRPKQHDTFISKLLNNKSKGDTGVVSKTEGNISEGAKINATTSKLEEEKLEQKVEVIDETPHVEAHAPKLDGFNLPPKVLGNNSFILELSKKKEDNEQLNLDELAKRCLGLPISDIDKILVQELKNINQENTQPKLDTDLIRNQCVKKSFSEKYMKFTNDEFQVYFEKNDDLNEYRIERIQPTHLDTTPLLRSDEEVKEFKDNTLIREFSTIYFTTDVDDTVPEIPAPLSPYEKQAIPFYEYINKESTMTEDESKIETAAITEQIQETEIIFHDERLQRDAIDGRSQVEEIETEQPLNPRPNVNQFSEPLRTHKSSEVQETTNLYQKLTQSNFLNVFAFQRFFTSSPDQPSDWFPDDTSQKNEQQNTAISATLTPGGDSRTLEIPSNTAISANQNPDEYYKMSFPDEFIIENHSKPLELIFAESPVTQNVIFSALPQQLDLEEDSVKIKAIDRQISKELISNMFDTEPKYDRDTDKAVQPNSDELSKKSDTISQTESIPLSLLLKRIREQNRLEYCRDVCSKTDIKLEGTKKFSCPPIDKSKSKGSQKPCQSKPKPACDQIQPCPPPAKKDPCAKFAPIFLTMSKCDITLDALKKPNSQSITYLALITGYVIQRLNALGQKLKYFSNDPNNNEIVCARDFEPWIPIPSWPIPKKEKASPFVCPKEGCKIPLPKITKHPDKGRECLEIPKKKKIYNVDYSENM